jgi:hypothetical protein
MYSNETKLKTLRLGGFQVFSETSEIPIAPITLLYGPNSAGKSAVHDALDLLRRFWTSLPADADADKWEFASAAVRRVALAKDWRRLDDRTFGEQPLVLDVELLVPRNKLIPPADIAVQFNMFELLNSGMETCDHDTVEAKLQFTPSIDATRTLISISVNGYSMLEYIEGESLCLNVQHSFFGSDSKLASQNWPAPLIMKGGWLCLTGLVVLNGHRQFDLGLVNKGILGGDEIAPISPRTWYEGLNYFQQIVGALLKRWSSAVADACTSRLVAASRTVPIDEELTYFFDDKLQGIEPSFRSLSRSRPEFEGVARSAALHLLQRAGSMQLSESELKDAEQVSVINRYLDNHLFTDRIFQIEAEVRRTMPVDEEPGVGAAEGPFIIRLRLRDAQGRRLSFTDVGSGVGYSLPVFCALACPSLAFIQQPELHLHPALQASMGDALIERVRQGGGVLFVETHSEHVLLRLLRRIRQTTDGRGGEFALLSTDISVVYVDPKPDGSSTVVRLPVTKSGEFTRKWPRGFFAERDEDLFGE